MRVAVTGVPGVGKSAVADSMDDMGLIVLRLDELAEEQGFIDGEEDGTKLVDIDKLQDFVRMLRSRNDIFLVAHYSHLVDHDAAIVLRCHPSVLEKRLRERAWSEAKIRENVEAEAIDVITVEALENGDRVYELDVTEMNPRATAQRIVDIVADESSAQRFKPGNIDWSEEGMKWY